eukprot:2483708-Rhodomonas_salina.1
MSLTSAHPQAAVTSFEERRVMFSSIWGTGVGVCNRVHPAPTQCADPSRARDPQGLRLPILICQPLV